MFRSENQSLPTRKFLTSSPSKALRLILIFCVVAVIALVSRPLDHLEYETIQLLIVCGVCVLLVWAKLIWRARFPVLWIGLFFGGNGAWGIYSDQLERQEAKSSLNFAPTIGTVVRTRAQNSGFGMSPWHTEYVVRYEYVIDGKKYKSSNVRYPNLKVWNTDPNKYPEHSRVCVYYDPSRPSHSCLERGYNRQLGVRGNYIYFLHLTTLWLVLITGITLVLSPVICSLVSNRNGAGEYGSDKSFEPRTSENR